MMGAIAVEHQGARSRNNGCTMSDSTSIDFRSCHTTTRFAQFWRVFPHRADSAFERSIARLCVLYEDLYLEVLGVSMEPNRLPLFEALGAHYRHIYFMRRAVATLLEFKQTVDQMSLTPEFQAIVAHDSTSKDAHFVRDWAPAQQFFKKNGKLLKAVRDDVGGHFGDEAATKALEKIGDDFCVRIEVQSDVDGRVRLLLPFATELAGTALLGHVPGGNFEEQFQLLRDILVESTARVVGAVHYLVEAVLWQRMG